jgi:phage internal scaffolding protein
MVKERKRVQKFFNNPSLTHQAFKEETDVNHIVKRFIRTEGDNFFEKLGNATDGMYGDFSEVVDYRTALDQVIAADEAFMALPAIVRKRFDNDPAQFLDFCGDPENLPEMRELGLCKPESSLNNEKVVTQTAGAAGEEIASESE